MKRKIIAFNKPYGTYKEIKYMKKALKNLCISGDGEFTKKVSKLLERIIGAKKVLLTPSCTSALEMAALLLNLKAGDEVIMPAYTFPSTATSFVLRGAKPVFVDIREDTLNINENEIEKKITKKTKAIVPVHYAGIGCEMNKIMQIAKAHNLYVVEDAAQGVNAKYENQYLGTIGDFGAYSFHETKNYSCGEGGALIINNDKFLERADIIRQKGTNRKKFNMGLIDKYTWVDVGSSYLLSDLLAAYLYAQLESMEKIQEMRKKIFWFYYENLKPLEKQGYIKLPVIPQNTKPNYHMFYLLLPSHKLRDKLIQKLQEKKICAIFHYVPLHLSVMGKKFGYKKGDFPIAEDFSSRLVRLPFYNKLRKRDQKIIIKEIKKFEIAIFPGDKK
ncbi:MAG: dTDP-4-amino-4,6-dideoxygalactose transaminase [bacterium]